LQISAFFYQQDQSLKHLKATVWWIVEARDRVNVYSNNFIGGGEFVGDFGCPDSILGAEIKHGPWIPDRFDVISIHQQL
jgi:hypothetical protein